MLMRCSDAASLAGAGAASVRFGVASGEGCAARFGAGDCFGAGGSWFTAAAFFERAFLMLKSSDRVIASDKHDTEVFQPNEY